MDMIRMIIVDDHPVVREGLAVILGSEADIQILGQGTTADEAVRLTRDLKPNMILLDLKIPGGGIEAAERISSMHLDIKIIVLTSYDEKNMVLKALKAGAHAYVLKGLSSHEFSSIIHKVHSGEGYVSPSLAAILLSDMTSTRHISPSPKDDIDELTERELSVLELISVGTSNKEIGQKLFLSEITVRHIVSSILQKLHVKNRVQAALIAQEKIQKKPSIR